MLPKDLISYNLAIVVTDSRLSLGDYENASAHFRLKLPPSWTEGLAHTTMIPTPKHWKHARSFKAIPGMSDEEKFRLQVSIMLPLPAAPRHNGGNRLYSTEVLEILESKASR